MTGQRFQAIETLRAAVMGYERREAALADLQALAEAARTIVLDLETT
ncbi:MAG: hypothetical protein VW362_07570 [Candidatus Nanopelagicales bacterium]